MRKTFLLLPVILALLTAGVACGPKAQEPGGTVEVQSASPVSSETAKYVCPMHPDVQSDKPGECPKCGMTLKSQSTGTHDHSTHKH